MIASLKKPANPSRGLLRGAVLGALLGCSAFQAKAPEASSESPTVAPAASSARPQAATSSVARLPPPAASSLAPELPSAFAVPLGPTPPPLEPLPAGTVVLHVGSSSAGAMGPSLNKALEAHGVKGVLKFKQSTFIRQWAGEEMGLKQHLAQYNPDLVLISLGGNEVSMPDPTRLIGQIQRLVKVIGDRPCVWVGTPRWKRLHHTGLLEVIRDNAAPCRFIDTDVLAPDMQPLKDGVHPTMPERRRWARRVLQWLRANRDPRGERPWSLKEVTVIPEDVEVEPPIPSEASPAPSAEAAQRSTPMSPRPAP